MAWRGAYPVPSVEQVGLKRTVRQAILATPARKLFEPRFVITGTGRSGTAYISAQLRAVGINCGHEQWWNPHGTKSLRLAGDASWLALFHLDAYRGAVFHQVRDPIRVIASLASTSLDARWREGRTVASSYHAYRSRHVVLTGDPLMDAMRTVDTYLAEAERAAQWTWRVEDVDGALICRIAAAIDKPITEIDAQAAVRSVATTTNRRDHELLGWHDLPNGRIKDRLLAHAENYGYL